ncbi:MAG TPA: 4Fe-4S cluster-binding domain-containing protein [Aliiroseovarius sp.]|nr:4Fe-4S cluster-binding domain-containing protein [Aliiroseovarius sp.]
MAPLATVVDGKIVPPGGVEMIVNDHCNISCRQCNHFSPILRKWNVDTEQLRQQLVAFGQVCRPAFVKLIGGEPLLHPDFTKVVQITKDAAISDWVLLVTNGMLLDRLSDAAWAMLDEVELSVYDGANLLPSVFSLARQKARQFGTKLTINRYPHFRYTLSSQTNEDPELVADIFAACKIANLWGCHGVYKNRFYKCPQSMYIPIVTNTQSFDFIDLSKADGLKDRLLDFINSTTPLNACRNCLGTVGRKLPHKLVNRRDWRQDTDMPVPEMLDLELLRMEPHAGRIFDDCKTPDGVMRRLKRWRHRLRHRG